MKLKLKGLSKIVFVFYLIYSQIIRSTVFSNSTLSAMISYVLLFAALLLQVINDNNRIVPTNTIWLFVLFVILEFFTAVFVAIDMQKSFTYLVVFLEYLIAFYLVRRYTEADKDIDFSVDAFIIVAFLMAITTLSRGAKIYGRISISESTNVNTVGVVMMFGIGLALFRFIKSKKNTRNILLLFVFVLPCIYVLVLTVSKKAMMGTAALLIGWMVICYGKAFSKQNVFIRVIILAIFVCVGYYAYSWFTSTQVSTYQYILYRFSSINDFSIDRSSGERLALLKEGISIFWNHPIIGIGYNNYRYYSNIGLYSHCFYIEILACTGIIGTVVFITPIVSSFIKYITVLRKTKERDEWLTFETRYLFFVFIILLILSWVQIIFYEFSLMYMLALLVSFIEVNKGYSYRTTGTGYNSGVR